MQNNIAVNVIAYHKDKKEIEKTVSFMCKMHSGKIVNKITAKIQIMTSKKTMQQINAPYAKFDLLCN